MMLDLAISCFEAQTYPNKQLIILYENHDQTTAEYIQKRAFPEVFKIIEVKCNPKMSLGELRNIAIEQADGEYICQWDDDDWYHVNRLQYQLDALVIAQSSGSILTHWLILDAIKNKLYISHARNWEGSLLCKKELFLLKKYDNRLKGEDTAMVEFLCDNNYIIKINELTGMYIYVYHGKNTWSLEHFEKIFNRCQEVTSYSDDNENILCLLPVEGSVLIDEILLLNNLAEHKANQSIN
jgi:glycosyltransferase involved in cell wall biosynthesis